MKLYEINKALEECFERALENESVIEELTMLALEKEEKVLSIGTWIKNLASDISSLRTEEQNLKARREIKQNKLESLKSYLEYAIPGEKYEDSRVKIGFRKSTKLEIDDVIPLPDEYKKTETIVKPDKKYITDTIKGGVEVVGCRLVETNNLQVK